MVKIFDREFMQSAMVAVMKLLQNFPAFPYCLLVICCACNSQLSCIQIYCLKFLVVLDYCEEMHHLELRIIYWSSCEQYIFLDSSVDLSR